MEDKVRIFNRTEDKPKRQQLRRESTPAERLLWAHLRGCQTGGMRFQRQYGVGPYVLDFYCPGSHLAVEVDGESHGTTEAAEYDAARTVFLNACGIRVLRFANSDVYRDPSGVAEHIAEEGKSSFSAN